MTLPTASERIANSLYGANIGVWDWRAEDGLSNVSASWCRMIGYEPGELEVSGHRWLALVHPDDQNGILADTFGKASGSDNAQFEVEYRIRHKQGHWVWIQAHGKVVQRSTDGRASHVSGINMDITERRRADAVLRQAHDVAVASETRFRSLTELSSDWYWEQDASFRFTEFVGNWQHAANRSLATTGVTRWEMPTLNMAEADWDAHRKVLHAHRVFHNLEILRQDNDGNHLWTSISGTPVFGPEGDFRGYRGIGRDITAQKKAEETIRELAFYDTLTGLPNRANLLDRLKDTVAT